MPIYEYECTECKTRFDRRQRFEDEPVAACPRCNAKARRVIHSVPVLFKGGGFYCTDHGKRSLGGNGRKGEDATSPSEATSAPKSEAKSDSTSETPSEASA